MAPEESDPLVTPAQTEYSESGGSPPVGVKSKRGRGRGRRGGSDGMLPQRDRRSLPERLLVRLVATAGIVGIGVAIAAIMVSSKSQGWMVGLVVSVVSVVLAAVLWSSRLL